MSNDKMRVKEIPDIQYFRECFDYCSTTGVLTWKFRPAWHFSTLKGMAVANSKCAGKPAGCLDKGYLKVRVAGQNYFVHQVAFLLMNGFWAPLIDHIDGDTINNRPENIRQATPQENQRNSAHRESSGTPLTGVHWHEAIGRWVAHIRISGSLKHLGSHLSLFEAACKRKSAEISNGYHINHGRAARIIR